MPVADTPDPSARLNSLSLIEPHPFPRMEVELEPEFDSEFQPPPCKKARARFIFQRCLKDSQDGAEKLTEVYAPPSDSEED